MTTVTNIYIDTTGFTDAQYAAADNAMDKLKSSDAIGWPIGDRHPTRKAYPVLCIDCDGDRQYLNSTDEVYEDDDTKHCHPVLLSDLVEMDMRAKYGKPLDLSGLKVMINGKPVEAGGQSITVLDGITPEKEHAVVNGLMDALLSHRLISKMAHGIVTGAMQGYYSANDTQP